MNFKTKIINEEFNQHLAALWVVIDRLKKAADWLNNCSARSLSSQECTTIGIFAKDYIVNNLNSLFNDRTDNSMLGIVTHFKKQLPHDFFVDYEKSVNKILVEFKDDLERIGNNRNRSSAHLGSSKRQKLGYDDETTKKLNELLGTQSSPAEKDSLLFITPNNVLELGIVKNISKIERVLEDLQIKLFEH